MNIDDINKRKFLKAMGACALCGNTAKFISANDDSVTVNECLNAYKKTTLCSAPGF